MTCQLTFDGKTRYIADWAELLGMQRTMIYNRLNSGWSFERALSTPPGANVKQATLTHKGRTQTVAEWTKERNFGRTVIRQRLKLGWSVERAIETPVNAHQN